MDSQYKTGGFDQILSEMPEPPTWEHVSAHRLAPTPRPSRTRGLPVVLVSFALTVVAVIAGVIVVRGGDSDTVGEGTVAYVELAWSQEVELRCQGLETLDNGGFDSATIEIWGPNAQGLVRIDPTASDGTVERLIVESGPLSPLPLRLSSYEDTTGSDTVFRISGCLQEEPSGAPTAAI